MTPVRPGAYVPSVRRNALPILFVFVVVDLLGFSLILPLLPYSAEAFHAHAFVTGIFVASYAAAQWIGAARLGCMSDRCRRRPILPWSSFGPTIETKESNDTQSVVRFARIG